MARVISPNFLKKCQVQPISQDQWQIVKYVFEFKSTHPIGIIFDGIRFGWIFSLSKDLFHNVYCDRVDSKFFQTICSIEPVWLIGRWEYLVSYCNAHKGTKICDQKVSSHETNNCFKEWECCKSKIK